MIKESAGNGNGAGYADENIDSSTGTAGVRSAYLGYNPDDGTYVAKEKPKQAYKFEALPTNTGNWLLDDANSQLNDANAYSAMDDNLKQLYSASRFGDSGSWTREGMDNYMLWEYGNSKYDTNPNVRDEEAAKYQRNAEQTTWVVAANGLPRMGVRALTTIGSGVSGIVKAVADCFGGNDGIDKYFSPEAFGQWGDDFTEFMNENVPVYQTKEQEESSALSGTRWTSGDQWAMMIDMTGFTIGAAATMYATRGMGPQLTAGLAALQASGAAMRAVTDEKAENRTAWQNVLPAAMAAAGAAGSKYLPPAWRNKLATVAAGIISASGEAEIETLNAKKEYINSKQQQIDLNIEERKNSVREMYASQIAAAQSEEERESLRAQMENQLNILDWQRTKAVNHSYNDMDDAAGIVRLGNYAVLTISNMLQFGKLLKGGWKTFQTSGRLAVQSEAKRAAQATYEQALRQAVGSEAKREVRRNRDKIISDALLKYGQQGGKLFDESTKLTAGEAALSFIEHPVVEGLEEINQAAASNAAKAYAERNTDDYYGQISGLEAFKRTDSAWQEAFRGFASTYGQEEAWSEFMAGALMGALGIPMLRSARFRRASGELDENGNIKETKKWRSPIYLEGGIYGEVKKAIYDKKNMGEMSKRLNETLTRKGVADFQKRLGYIAHHMQYEQDMEDASNAMYENKKGDKYRFMNAQDADLVKMVELFQNTGQIGLLKAMVRTNLDFETAADLRTLQEATNEKDESGNVTGPYSEFDLTDPGENASDAAKQHLREEVDRMCAKLKEQTEHDLKVIDSYEKARLDLKVESNSGLGDDNLNCLAWYRTRISMFDERTRSMFEKNKGSLDKLNKAMPDVFERLREHMVRQAEEASKDTSIEAKAREDKARQYKDNIVQLDLAEAEWNDRWERSQKADDDMTRARILFAGNKKADPIGSDPAKIPFWLKKPFWVSDAQWAKRVSPRQGEAARRRKALMGLSLDQFGIEAQVAPGVIDMIIDDLNSKEPALQELSDMFGDDSERHAFAMDLNDMRQCQAAVVRYKDLYQFYKDNPQAGAARRHEEEKKAEEEADKEDAEAVRKEMADAKTVSELYDAIVKNLNEGKDPESITRSLEEMAKNGSKIAEQLLKNQEYVRAIARALKHIIADNGKEKEMELTKSIVLQVAINASRRGSSVAGMHKYIQTVIASLSSDSNALVNFIKDNNLSDKADFSNISVSRGSAAEVFKKITGLDLADNSTFDYIIKRLDNPAEARAALDTLRKQIPQLQKMDIDIRLKKVLKDKYSEELRDQLMDALEDYVNDSESVQDTADFEDVQKNLPELLNIVDKRIKHRQMMKQAYDFGKDSNAKEPDVLKELSDALSQEANEKTAEILDKISEIGGQDLNSTSSEAKDNSETEPATRESKDNNSDNDYVILDDDAVTGGPVSVEEMVEDNEEDAKEDAAEEKAAKPQVSATTIRPSLAYFSLQHREKGKIVRNSRVRYKKDPTSSSRGVVEECQESESSFRDMWNTLEGLGAFSCIDDVAREDAESINAGDDVYFIIDKMNSETGRSEILGMSSGSILEFSGKPIIWMCVKRSDGSYQSIGAVPTSEWRTKGISALHAAIRKGYAENGGRAYIHPVTAKVGNIHSGLVETQASENNLDRVFGGDPILAVSTGTSTYTNTDQPITTAGMKPGVIYAMVKDNATGNYVPMECRVAHYNESETKRLKGTPTLNAVESALSGLVTAAATESTEDAQSKVGAYYVELSNLLALRGYGVHINLEIGEKGERSIVLTKVVFKDGKPVQKLDKTGRPVVKVDNEGNVVKDKDGNPIPVWERSIPVKIKVSPDSTDTMNRLKGQLMGKSFNVPFRVSLNNLKEGMIKDLISDGVVTTNIVDGGGLRTRGGFAEVDASEAEKRSKGEPVNDTKEEEELSEEMSRLVSKEGVVETDKDRRTFELFDKSFEVMVREGQSGPKANTVTVDGKQISNRYLMAKFAIKWVRAENHKWIYDTCVVVENDDGSAEVYTKSSIQASKPKGEHVSSSKLPLFIDRVERSQRQYKLLKKMSESAAAQFEKEPYLDKEELELMYYNNKEEFREAYQKRLTKAEQKEFIKTFSEVFSTPYNIYYIKTDPTKEIVRIINGEKFHYSPETKQIVHEGEVVMENVEPEMAMGVLDDLGMSKTEEEAQAEEESQAAMEAEQTRQRPAASYSSAAEAIKSVTGFDVTNIPVFSDILTRLDNPSEAQNAIGDLTRKIPSLGYLDIDIRLKKALGSSYTKELRDQVLAALNEYVDGVGRAQEVPAVDDSQQQEDGKAEEEKDETQGGMYETETERIENERKSEEEEKTKESVNERKKRTALNYQDEKKEDESDSIEDLDYFSIVEESDQNNPQIDVSYEIGVLRKILPWLTRNDAIMIVDGLMETGRKGVVAQGIFKNGLIALSQKGVRGTAFHEAFHAVFHTALSDEERAEIIKEAKRETKLVADIDAEEALADMFRDYMIDRTYGKTWGKRIKDFFRWLLELVGLRGDDSMYLARSVFGKIAAGGYAKNAKQYDLETIKEMRRRQYRHMGYSESHIRYLEETRNCFQNQPAEVRRMLEESGVSEEAFDMLSSKSREELVRCL